MTGERLTTSEKRALLLWVVAGILGVWFAHRYYFSAFPEASVNFQVTRAEALARARSFVTAHGEPLAGYQSTIVFSVDENAKTYLEREAGLKRANQLMASELNVWYWQVRFFRPGQEEQYSVRVSPAGRIVGYSHKIPEARAAASLSREAAQQAAEQFLVTGLGKDANAWQYLPEEANSDQRPNRLDWSFTWEKRGFLVKDARDRLEITLQGQSAGAAREFVKVPEEWTRSYEHLRSANIFYNQVAIVPYIFLFGAALGLGILLARRGQTNWGGALKLGAVAAILLFFMKLNAWPLDRANYDTNSSYGSFVSTQIVTAILFAVGAALTISLVLPGGEPLYRAAQPNRLRLGRVFTPRGMRSKEFFSAATVGLCMAAAHIGFLVAFYIVASHFGAWAPQDLSYDDSINTAIPWVAGMAIGLLAATSEEFLFRLFAVPFFERITGSRIIAVVVPAFCWSFLHSAYPQEPPYIRGLEVGLIGIVAGVVMLRWGIVSTLVWHYTVDASLVGLVLLRSHSPYLRVSGTIVGAAAALPLLYSAISYLRRGGFEPAEDLLNRAVPPPDVTLALPAAELGSSQVQRRYDALPKRALVFLAICALAGGAILWRVHPAEIGSYLRLDTDARGARAAADAALHERGVDPRGWHRVATFENVTDPYANEYLRRTIGIAAANKLYAGPVPGALWRVRYFHDGEPEEYAVILNPDDSLHSVHHVVAESAAGASLSKDEAVERASAFLTQSKHLDLREWSLVESNSTKRIHRTDHDLTWQKNTPLDTAAQLASVPGHAFERIHLVVQGDEVTDYRTFIKIPDEWEREQKSRTLPRTLHAIGSIAFFVALAVTILVLFLRQLRSPEFHEIPWRRFAVWTGWVLTAFLLVFCFGTKVPEYLSQASTAIPLKFQYGALGIGAALGALLYAAAAALLFAIAWFCAARTFGAERVPGWLRMPAGFYRDAFWIALGGSIGLLGLRHALYALGPHFPTLHRALPAGFGNDFDAYFPALSIAGTAVLRGLLLAGVVGVLGAFIGWRVRGRIWRGALFAVGALALTGDWGSPADFAKQFVFQLLVLAVIVWGVVRIVRLNLMGYFLLIACTILLEGATELLTQPAGFYRANGIAVLVMLLALLAWPCLLWRSSRSPDGA